MEAFPHFREMPKKPGERTTMHPTTHRLTLLAATLLLAPTLPAQSLKPTTPAIFAIAFTNLTDTSVRLVFTTTEPMATTVDIYDGPTPIAHLSQPAFEEIHAIPLGDATPLTRLHPYRILIHATGQTPTAQATAETTLTPSHHPPTTHTWPGYTLFSSTINGPGDRPDALDLFAASGARMARCEISWDGVYPRRGQLNHAYLDRWLQRIAEMKRRGIEPLVLLDYSVAWAMPYTHQTMTWRNPNFGPPDALADWQQFVQTVVTALHGSAHYYEIWNEPDAGYLATGSFVERPNVPAPIGRPPFKDNIPYWIGDRYAPIVTTARQTIAHIDPTALVMNGGWNRDYSGARGDILFDRGAASSLDLYAYHVYSHSPTSFSRWYKELDTGFLECPAFYVPVLVRETGQKGADDGEGQEAYS
jgi:hypothetical protein